MTSTQPRPEPAPPADGRAQPGQSAEPEPEPAVPRERSQQAREDTDAAWGDYPDTDDERLYRDRPPHWADF